VGVIVGSFMLLFSIANIIFRVPISPFMAKFPVSNPRTPDASIGTGLLFGSLGLFFLIFSLIGR
jgi:hypothetical protein